MNPIFTARGKTFGNIDFANALRRHPIVYLIMPVPTPIKRSKELAPLSREHHNGLLFVFKIKQGLKLGIDKERIGAFCSWSWDSHFNLHFRKEEAALVPVLGMPHPLIERMLSEHGKIQTLFESINVDLSFATLESLAQCINDHIRFEERQLFSLIEQVATPERLKVIEQSLAVAQPACSQWADEFWIVPK